MKNKGFTLLEITMALTIFAIGIMGIIALFPQGMKGVKATLKDLVVATAAQTIIRVEKSAGTVDGRTGKYLENIDDDGLHFVDEHNEEIRLFDFDYRINLIKDVVPGAANVEAVMMEVVIEDVRSASDDVEIFRVWYDYEKK